jgi:hypothetical protein
MSPTREFCGHIGFTAEFVRVNCDGVGYLIICNPYKVLPPGLCSVRSEGGKSSWAPPFAAYRMTSQGNMATGVRFRRGAVNGRNPAIATDTWRDLICRAALVADAISSEKLSPFSGRGPVAFYLRRRAASQVRVSMGFVYAWRLNRSRRVRGSQ